MVSAQEVIDSIKQMNMMEVFELVHAIEEEFNISAAPPVIVPDQVYDSGPPVVVSEQTEFTVTLEETRERKVEVIKAVRQLITIGLGDAKKLVESAPVVIKEDVSKVDAESMKESLEKVGALVTIS